MINIKYIVAMVVILVIAIIGLFFPKGNTIVEQIARTGAISNLSAVDSPYVKIGGNERYYYSQTMVGTSSAVCQIKNPFNATSTLIGYSFQVTSNGLGAQTIDVSTSTTAYGTSSPAYVKAYSAGSGQFSVVWGRGATTTSVALIGNTGASQGFTHNVIGPNEYVNTKVATATPGTFSSYYTGTCRGVFEKL